MAQQSFIKRNAAKLFLGPLIIVLAVGLTWLKFSPNKLEGVKSQAGFAELQPHWAHSSIPFKLPLLNSASRFWSKHLVSETAAWQDAGVLNFDVRKGNNGEPCYFYPELINFCSQNDPEGGLASGGFIYMNATGHIITAALMLNDAYLNNPESMYNTKEYRNKFLCYYLGFTLGLNSRYEEPSKSESCMDPLFDPERIANQQYPDSKDLHDFKVSYDHKDDTSSSGVARKTSEMKPFSPNSARGSLVKSINGGQQELYKRDLGDGYTQVTFVENKPTAISPKGGSVQTPATKTAK